MENATHMTAPGSSPGREFPLPPVLRMFWACLCALTFVNWVAGNIYFQIGRYRNCCTLAYDDPLFVDFWHYAYIFRFFHTSAFFHNSERFAYPAFSAVVYDALYHLGPHAQAIFLTTELVVCGSATFIFFGKIRSLGLRRFPAAIFVVSALLFSYPLLYMFEAGSVEIVTCFLTAAGLWAALKNNDKTAAGLWGAAAALKIYPLVLLALFLSRAKWRYLLFGVATFGLISAVSMWFVGPTIAMALSGSISGVGGFVSHYAETVRTQELPFDHSLLAPVKIALFALARRTGTLSYLTKPYMLIVATAATLVFFLKVQQLPVVNRALFLFAAMVALPPISYDHTLVHLYAPWAMLVVVALRAGMDEAYHDLRGIFLCFAVLFTSQNYIYYHWIHINGTVKAIALVALMAASVLRPIPEEALYGPAPAISKFHLAANRNPLTTV